MTPIAVSTDARVDANVPIIIVGIRVNSHRRSCESSSSRTQCCADSAIASETSRFCNMVEAMELVLMSYIIHIAMTAYLPETTKKQS